MLSEDEYKKIIKLIGSDDKDNLLIAKQIIKGYVASDERCAIFSYRGELYHIQNIYQQIFESGRVSREKRSYKFKLQLKIKCKSLIYMGYPKMNYLEIMSKLSEYPLYASTFLHSFCEPIDGLHLQINKIQYDSITKEFELIFGG